MRFSLAYEMQRPTLDDHAVIEETIEQCILADEMGFDAVWFVEHHFLTTFSGSPCPEVIFGALSRLTKNNTIQGQSSRRSPKPLTSGDGTVVLVKNLSFTLR